MAEIVAAKRLRPKTYSVAIYLVIAVIIIQVGAFISIFYFRHKVKIDTSAPSPLAEVAAHAGPGVSAPVPAVAPVPVSPADQNRISPAGPPRLNVERFQDSRELILSLNEEGAKFRREGEFALAKTVLTEAEDHNPRDPLTLTNIALLAEAQNDSLRARNYWQRILDIGPSAGTAYQLAKEQMALMPDAQKANSGASPEKAVSPYPNRLYFDKIDRAPVDPNRPTKDFNMRIVIAAKDTGRPIDPGKVGLKLFFYDKMPNSPPVSSASRPNVRFEGEATWQNNRKETIAANVVFKDEQREYYGYVLRIYYEGELQDERVEPPELLRMVPAGPTAK